MPINLIKLCLFHVALAGMVACTPKDNSATEDMSSVAASKNVKIVAMKADTPKVCASANEEETTRLSCPSGQIVKSIEFASYGTPSGSCGSYKASSCNASTSLSVIQKLCIGKASCDIYASNNVFGDPCKGTGKRVRVQATCGDAVVSNPTPTPVPTVTPTPAPTATPSPIGSNLCGSVEESLGATIACPSGQKIVAVGFASYGLIPSGSCGSYKASSSCNASNSVSVVQSACVGKSSCYIEVNNSKFGDPCPGQGKYLTYQVQCSGSVSQPTPTPTPTPTPVPTATPAPTPTPSPTRTPGSVNSCLPFQQYDKATLRAKPKKIFGHYMSNFSLSIDNLAASVDYYTTQWLNPFGENSQFLNGGGFLRARPLPMSPLSASNWTQLNMQKEVRRAIAMGLDGFTVMILGTSGDNWSAVLDLLDAAKAVDSGFKIMLVADGGSASESDWDTAVTTFNNHPSAYRLDDGRLVVSPFNAEGSTVSQWTTRLNRWKSKGINVAFMPMFLSMDSSVMNSFSSLSFGYSDWGPRDEDNAASMVNSAASVHSYGKIYMAPVAPNDVRPKDLWYIESHNSGSFRNLWMSAINGNADWVQLITWNDYSEHTHVSPSAGYKGEMQRAYYDLSAYYLSWFKMGAQPAITNDVLYYFHRRHAANLKPSSTAKQKGTFEIAYGSSYDDIELVAFLTSPGRLEISIGGKVSTMDAPAGITSFKVPLGLGKPSFRLLRNNAAVISFQSQTEIVNSIEVSDLTYQSGSASSAGTCYTFSEP